MYRQLRKKLVKQQYLLHISPQYGELRPTNRGADPGGAGGAAAPPILILVVQTYHFAPPIIPVHK